MDEQNVTFIPANEILELDADGSMKTMDGRFFDPGTWTTRDPGEETPAAEHGIIVGEDQDGPITTDESLPSEQDWQKIGEIVDEQNLPLVPLGEVPEVVGGFDLETERRQMLDRLMAHLPSPWEGLSVYAEIFYGAEELFGGAKRPYVHILRWDAISPQKITDEKIDVGSYTTRVTQGASLKARAIANAQRRLITEESGFTPEEVKVRTIRISSLIPENGKDLTIEQIEDHEMIEAKDAQAAALRETPEKEMAREEDRLSEFEKRRREIRERVTKGELAPDENVSPDAPGDPSEIVREVIRVKGQDEARMIIESAILLGHNVMLEGHTGVGKTTLLAEIAHDHGRKLIRVNLNGQTGKEDFVGQWLVRSGEHGSETFFAYGTLVEAMRAGHWLVCDEINAALPEILFVLQSLLDDDRQIRLTEKDGEVIRAHPDFRFFSSMNPSDEYAGTKELNGSLKSRFGTWIQFDYPEPAIEQEILMTRTGIDPAQAAIMVDVAQRLRTAKSSGLCYMPISTRDLLRWAEQTIALKNRALAFKYTILNRAGLDAPFFSQTLKAADQEFDRLMKEVGRKVDPSVLILGEIRQSAQKVKDAEKKIEEAEAQAREIINVAVTKADAEERRIAEMINSIAERERQVRERLTKEMAQMMAQKMEGFLAGGSPSVEEIENEPGDETEFDITLPG
jgi:MoxR-like ATPase